MTAETTIIFITDNELEPKIWDICQRQLKKAVGDHPLISVSQEPIDLGENICVGKIGRSSLNIDKQMLAGIEKADTKFIAIAEHDCLYLEEHFDWIPPDEEHFFYNLNSWLLQASNPNWPQYDGMFSYVKNRRALSQVIAGRDSMRKALESKIEILSDPSVREKWPGLARLGEPGTAFMHRQKRLFKDPKIHHQFGKVRKYITTFNAKTFKTKLPTIDIRHGGNFTGARRGGRRRWELEPWGTMEDIFNGA